MMNSWKELIYRDWQRKVIALFAAAVIWVLVNHSITLTRTISNVPIRIVGLPEDKTAEGLLPSGLFSERVTLTITGNKSVIEELDPTFLEVVIDAEGKGDEWLAQISKKNLRSLDPDIELQRNITDIEHGEFLIHLEKLITTEIPVHVRLPTGEAPEGYQLLDIWPQLLSHKVSGPESQVLALQEKGLDLSIDLSQISIDDLDALSREQQDEEGDEVVFYVPNHWKQVRIAFKNNLLEPINDLDAKYLHIDFLRTELQELEQDLPISVFFPLGYSKTINPDTYEVALNEVVGRKNGVTVVNLPLYVGGVSRAFLETVLDRMAINVVTVPKSVTDTLPWSLQFIDPAALENAYIARLTRHTEEEKGGGEETAYLRERFRSYLRNVQLYHQNGEPLQLRFKLSGSAITVVDETAKG